MPTGFISRSFQTLRQDLDDSLLPLRANMSINTDSE